MWGLIPERKMPPTRLVRYCCEKLKESGGKGRVTVTGVRWAESVNRKNTHSIVDIITQSKKLHDKSSEIEGAGLNTRGNIILNDDNDNARRFVEHCYRTRKTLLNPIVDWTDDDVWEFLNNVVKVPHCELYDKGYKRIGCVGCPMSNNRGKELKEYPAFRKNYLLAFEKLIQVRKEAGLPTDWETPEDVMKWWLGSKYEDSI